MSTRPLTEILDIRRDTRVATIGGGGKASVLLELGREWSGSGGRPMILPTTRLVISEAARAPDVKVVALAQARSAWPAIDFPVGSLLIVGRRDEERADVLTAILPDEITPLIEQVRADLVLLKADGARGRSLKAHKEHEPVVPLDTGMVVAVAGLDVWGAPLGPETVHRPDVFAVKWGMTPGERLEDDAFLYALGDPAGYRSALPAGARYVVFLNKVDRPMRVAVAQRLAHGLIERGVTDVIFGNVRTGDWTHLRGGAR